MCKTTAPAPALHFPVPSCSSVAEGTWRTGPTPQISFAGFGRREKSLVLDIAQPEGIDRRRLVDDREDGPMDPVPLFIEVLGDNGLDVENILHVVFGAISEIEVVLKRHADQVRYGVL